MAPRLSFFNEQDAPECLALSRDAATLKALRALSARVTMGLRDLSHERAEAVRGFVDAGVPVDGWVLLPREQGYFATPDNAAQVARRVDEVRRWLTAHALPLRTLGFDFEPDLRELDALFHRPLRTLAGWWLRADDRARRERALEQYRALLEGLRGDGFTVETYQVPFLLDDRRVDGTWLQRLVGALDVPADREVLMLYSSLWGPWGAGLLASYARGAGAVAVGSTGGGIDPLPKLTWDELARDLRLAAAATDDVAIFSLEGCVAHGYLARLPDLDWQQAAVVPRGQAAGAAAARAVVRSVARLLR